MWYFPLVLFVNATIKFLWLFAKFVTRIHIIYFYEWFFFSCVFVNDFISSFICVNDFISSFIFMNDFISSIIFLHKSHSSPGLILSVRNPIITFLASLGIAPDQGLVPFFYPQVKTWLEADIVRAPMHVLWITIHKERSVPNMVLLTLLLGVHHCFEDERWFSTSVIMFFHLFTILH